MVLMILPCIVSPPWPGRASYATPRCVYPAVGLMEMSACSWSIHFDAMNCSGVHTLPMCQKTVCIQLCDIWTQRYWEEVWDISDTLVSRQEDAAQNVSPLMQARSFSFQHITSRDTVTLIQIITNNINSNLVSQIATEKESHPVDHNIPEHFYHELNWNTS